MRASHRDDQQQQSSQYSDKMTPRENCNVRVNVSNPIEYEMGSNNSEQRDAPPMMHTFGKNGNSQRALAEQKGTILSPKPPRPKFLD